MNYDSIPQDLPIEIVNKIMSFIDLASPSCIAFRSAEIRLVSNIELLGRAPPEIMELEDIMGVDELHYY
jgi:hypothetical protein